MTIIDFLVELNEAKLERVMVTLAYNFQNPSLLLEALQVAGTAMWTTTDGRTLKQGNKSLAGIGDRIISLYITEAAFNEGLTIGDTNRMLQARASNEYLAGIFDALCLDEEIVKNPCQPDKVSMRTKATTVEAIVGAVYQDGGMDGAMAVLEYLNI